MLIPGISKSGVDFPDLLATDQALKSEMPISHISESTGFNTDPRVSSSKLTVPSSDREVPSPGHRVPPSDHLVFHVHVPPKSGATIGVRT